MKKIVYLVLTSLLLIACNSKKPEIEKVDISLEKETIANVLNIWHKNAAEAKFKPYFKALDTSGIFIGTDASENWTIPEFKEFSKPFFDRGSAWDFKPIQRNIYINNEANFAWFDELLDTWMGVCRGSGVLLKNEDSWKIKHYVLSVTIPNSNITNVIDIKKEADSIFIQKLRK